MADTYSAGMKRDASHMADPSTAQDAKRRASDAGGSQSQTYHYVSVAGPYESNPSSPYPSSASNPNSNVTTPPFTSSHSAFPSYGPLPVTPAGSPLQNHTDGYHGRVNDRRTSLAMSSDDRLPPPAHSSSDYPPYKPNYTQPSSTPPSGSPYHHDQPYNQYPKGSPYGSEPSRRDSVEGVNGAMTPPTMVIGAPTPPHSSGRPMGGGSGGKPSPLLRRASIQHQPRMDLNPEPVHPPVSYGGPSHVPPRPFQQPTSPTFPSANHQPSRPDSNASSTSPPPTSSTGTTSTTAHVHGIHKPVSPVNNQYQARPPANHQPQILPHPTHPHQHPHPQIPHPHASQMPHHPDQHPSQPPQPQQPVLNGDGIQLISPYSRSPELRVSHKLAERKRRKEMKDLFDELKGTLPDEAFRNSKASKWEILSKAIDYIETLALAGKERDALREENMELQKRLAAITMKMEK
ncbi:hypothetical protein HDU97_004332 [Phlyctochytrium planicorne]|nr:hypothetical protein HDU97_004332 [Phlyctochytrium planicorne]